MAEHNLKLVISADTSDAEKKLKDVGNTKVPAIKVDVTAEKVKVDAPKVEPVKVPVEADEVKVDAPKVEPPKPVELTVGIKDEEAKRRLAEITALHEIPCKPVGVSAKDGEKFLIEFQPDDTKVVNALREVTAQEHVVIVGMRANYEDAQRLYKELSKPVEKPVKVVEKREESPSKEHKAESVRVTEKRDPPKEVKHKDETVNVKTNVQQPKPIEAKAKKVVVEVSDEEAKKKIEALTAEEGVKRVRVVTENGKLAERKSGKERFEIEFDADDTQARQKIAALRKDSRIIPVTIQTKFDETGVGRFVKTLHGVREIAGRVMSALGLVGFVVGIVMSAVAAFNALKSKIEEVTTRAARLAFALEMKSAASETDRLCSSHERLAKLLKDELDTLSKQKAVRAIKETGAQDLEDGRRAADRARQIYEAKTPEEEQALRDKFAVEDEQIARSRRQKTRETQIKDLDEEESAYTSKAKGLKQNNADIDKQIEEERLNVKRAANPRIRRGGGEEEASEEEKAAKARVKALEERKKANEAEIAEYEREAKFRREQIAALQGVKDYDGESAASLAARQRDKEKARENDKATTEADSDWRERRERERKKKDIDEAVKYQKDPGNKRAILDAQADNAQSEADALRKQYEAEMKKSASVRDAAKLTDLRAKIDERESTADSYRDQSKKITVDENTKRADDLESFAKRAASVDGVSQNRLTAMGLGSGVTAKGTVQSDVRRLVDLLRQNVEATKNIKFGDLPDATYGE